ncbi:conserved Plasmodium protein, unknown function [Plasmodium sp. gorilla clade G2]|uniref:conserved Plasmodium protein, unknown function n=1 Tax=Plasmodium sp. gorilla clade G2 TaxID=880535 RepID=UPI000D223D24|nr:conserved Plasmodium protein, unknown function [Plasmodium sp. gorilla clade G2]SOV16558.1 conserved Plasmodium protein, unknown function [Plasmodium sp. gorilla clade G2]
MCTVYIYSKNMLVVNSNNNSNIYSNIKNDKVDMLIYSYYQLMDPLSDVERVSLWLFLFNKKRCINNVSYENITKMLLYDDDLYMSILYHTNILLYFEKKKKLLYAITIYTYVHAIYYLLLHIFGNVVSILESQNIVQFNKVIHNKKYNEYSCSYIKYNENSICEEGVRKKGRKKKKKHNIITKQIINIYKSIGFIVTPYLDISCIRYESFNTLRIFIMLYYSHNDTNFMKKKFIYYGYLKEIEKMIEHFIYKYENPIFKYLKKNMVAYVKIFCSYPLNNKSIQNVYMLRSICIYIFERQCLKFCYLNNYILQRNYLKKSDKFFLSLPKLLKYLVSFGFPNKEFNIFIDFSSYNFHHFSFNYIIIYCYILVFRIIIYFFKNNIKRICRYIKYYAMLERRNIIHVCYISLYDKMNKISDPFIQIYSNEYTHMYEYIIEHCFNVKHIISYNKESLYKKNINDNNNNNNYSNNNNNENGNNYNHKNKNDAKDILKFCSLNRINYNNRKEQEDDDDDDDDNNKKKKQPSKYESDDIQFVIVKRKNVQINDNNHLKIKKRVMKKKIEKRKKGYSINIGCQKFNTHILKLKTYNKRTFYINMNEYKKVVFKKLKCMNKRISTYFIKDRNGFTNMYKSNKRYFAQILKKKKYVYTYESNKKGNNYFYLYEQSFKDKMLRSLFYVIKYKNLCDNLININYQVYDLLNKNEKKKINYIDNNRNLNRINEYNQFCLNDYNDWAAYTKNDILNYISNYLYVSHIYNDFEKINKTLQRIFTCDMDTFYNNNNIDEIINLNNSDLHNQNKYNISEKSFNSSNMHWFGYKKGMEDEKKYYLSLNNVMNEKMNGCYNTNNYVNCINKDIKETMKVNKMKTLNKVVIYNNNNNDDDNNNHSEVGKKKKKSLEEKQIYIDEHVEENTIHILNLQEKNLCKYFQESQIGLIKYIDCLLNDYIKNINLDKYINIIYKDTYNNNNKIYKDNMVGAFYNLFSSVKIDDMIKCNYETFQILLNKKIGDILNILDVLINTYKSYEYNSMNCSCNVKEYENVFNQNYEYNNFLNNKYNTVGNKEVPIRENHLLVKKRTNEDNQIYKKSDKIMYENVCDDNCMVNRKVSSNNNCISIMNQSNNGDSRKLNYFIKNEIYDFGCNQRAETNPNSERSYGIIYNENDMKINLRMLLKNDISLFNRSRTVNRTHCDRIENNSNDDNNNIYRGRYINQHNIISNECMRQHIKYTNINYNNNINNYINENVRKKNIITQNNPLNYNTNEEDKEKISYSDNHIHMKRTMKNYSHSLDIHSTNKDKQLNDTNNCNFIKWKNVLPYSNSCKNKYDNKIEMNNFDNNIINKYEKNECNYCSNKIQDDKIYNIVGKVKSENSRNIHKSNRTNNTDNILGYNREKKYMSSFCVKKNSSRRIYKDENKNYQYKNDEHINDEYINDEHKNDEYINDEHKNDEHKNDEYINDCFLNIKGEKKSIFENAFKRSDLKFKLINEENITKPTNNVYVNISQKNDIEKKMEKQRNCNNSLLQLSLYGINKSNNNNGIIIHNNYNINNMDHLSSCNNIHSSNNVVSTNNIDSSNYRNDMCLNTNDRIIFHQYKNSCMINDNDDYEINNDYNSKSINECEAEDTKDTNDVKEISNDVFYNYLNDMNERFYYNYLDYNKYDSNNNYHNNHNCSNNVYYNYDSIMSSENQIYKHIQECKDINFINDIQLYKLSTIKNKDNNIINGDIMQSYKNKNSNNNYDKGNVGNYYDIKLKIKKNSSNMKNFNDIIKYDQNNDDIKVVSNMPYDFLKKKRNSTENTLLINNHNNNSTDNYNNNNNNNNNYYNYNINSDLLFHQLNNISNNRNNDISLERRLNDFKNSLINKNKTNETGEKQVDVLRNLKSKIDVFSYVENYILDKNIERNKNYMKLKINEIEDTKTNNKYYKNYEKCTNKYNSNNNNNNVIFNIDGNACKTSNNKSRTLSLQNENIRENEFLNSIKMYENINENYNVLKQNINNIKIKNELRFPEQNSHHENNNDVINNKNNDDNICNNNIHLMNQISNTKDDDLNVKMINSNQCSFSNNNIKETCKDKKKIQDILHINGQCKPCAFFYNKNKGCRNGDSCEFCHHVDHSNLSLKQWKKQQKKMMKLGLLNNEKQNIMARIDITNKEKEKSCINKKNITINNENYIKKNNGKLNEPNNHIEECTSENKENTINKQLNNYDIFTSQQKLCNDVTSMNKKECNKQSDNIFNNSYIDGYNVNNVRNNNHISNNSIIINKRMISNNKIVINNQRISNKNMIFNNNIISNNIIMYNKKKSSNSSSSSGINAIHRNKSTNNFISSNILRNMTNKKIDFKNNMIFKKMSTNNCEMKNLNPCSLLSNASENGSYKTNDFLNENEKYKTKDNDNHKYSDNKRGNNILKSHNIKHNNINNINVLHNDNKFYNIHTNNHISDLKYVDRNITNDRFQKNIILKNKTNEKDPIRQIKNTNIEEENKKYLLPFNHNEIYLGEDNKIKSENNETENNATLQTKIIYNIEKNLLENRHLNFNKSHNYNSMINNMSPLNMNNVCHDKMKIMSRTKDIEKNIIKETNLFPKFIRRNNKIAEDFINVTDNKSTRDITCINDILKREPLK